MSGKPTFLFYTLLNDNRAEINIRTTRDGGFSASIDTAEIKRGIMLHAATGFGMEPTDAIEDLIEKLRGSTLVFNAMDEMKRKEVLIL